MHQVDAEPYDWPHDGSISPETTALVIIDMQRDFCEQGGYLSHQGYDISPTRAIIAYIAALLTNCRHYGYPVFHTREGHRPDLSDLPARELFRSRNNRSGLGIGDRGPLGRLLVHGEAGHDIIEELYPREGEPIIDKPGKGAFTNTDFDLLLKVKGIKNLIICGVTTDVCVHTTMREANDRGFDCLLVSNCCAASEAHLHDAAVEMVRTEGGIFGATARFPEVIFAIMTALSTYVPIRSLQCSSLRERIEADFALQMGNKSQRKMDQIPSIQENILIPTTEPFTILKQCPLQIGFFDLPATLRDKAYSYINCDFVNADEPSPSTLTVRTNREDLQSTVQTTWSRLADLLVVSKQFSKEFKDVWLSEFTFEFSHSEIPPHGDFDPAPSDVPNFYHVLEFLEAFTEEERSHIEHIKVTHEIERTVTYTSEQVERALNHALGDVWPEKCIIELEIKRMRTAPFNDIRTFTCSREENNRIQIEVSDAKWNFVSDEVVGYWDADSEARMRMEETISRQT